MNGKTYYIRKLNSFPNAVVQANKVYCVMTKTTQNDIISKEIIILQIYGNR